MEDIQKIIEFANRLYNDWFVLTTEQRNIVIRDFLLVFFVTWFVFILISCFFFDITKNVKSIPKLIKQFLSLSILSIYTIINSMWICYYYYEKCKWFLVFLYCEYFCIKYMVHMIRQGRITGEYHYTAYPIGKAVMQDCKIRYKVTIKINDK